MKIKHIAYLISLATSLPAVPVFIGTNTGEQTTSKGIYLADFDPANGKLTEPKLAADYQEPGFLALHPSLPVLLCIGSPKTPFQDGTNSVAAFSIGENNVLTFLGETSSGGKGACHLDIDPAGTTVAVANYSDGNIATIRLDPKGIPTSAVTIIRNQGSGPNPSRQQSPHAHGVYFNRLGTHLFVPDLGIDKVLIYPFDAATSKLGAPLPCLTTAPGAGPRHMAFSPDEKNAYIINELDNTVLTALHENGALKPLATLTTLPAGFSANNSTAEIEVSADNRFVYASNRGHDSIAVFSRNTENGTLTSLQIAPCGGKAPRHFKISPDGKWLLCAHMESHTISVLPRNPQTGELGSPICTVPSPSPICLTFSR